MLINYIMSYVIIENNYYKSTSKKYIIQSLVSVEFALRSKNRLLIGQLDSGTV